MPARLKVFFDGGCRPNPGQIEIAVVARGIVHLADDRGEGDNSDAEWLALIEALRVAQRTTDGPFDLIGDSRVVIDRATGAARCRSAHEQAYRERFWAEAGDRPPTRIRWIRRAQNLAGIALERRRAGLTATPRPAP